jgi:phosphoglycolate phosphatase-like HAD superfamily hydrolase
MKADPGVQGRAMRYRRLMLDHDDTAVMSTPLVHYPSHVKAMKDLRPDHAPIGLDGWFRKMFSPGFEPYHREELGLATDEMAQNYRVWREVTSSIVPEFFPGILAILAEFKRRGGILVVVSHSEVGFVQRDYRAASAAIEGRVSPNLVFGGDVKAEERKPHPFPVIAAINRFGLAKRDVLVVDDLRSGMDMAEAAGVDFVAAGWGHSIPEIKQTFRRRGRPYCETVMDFGRFLLTVPHHSLSCRSATCVARQLPAKTNAQEPLSQRFGPSRDPVEAALQRPVSYVARKPI